MRHVDGLLRALGLDACGAAAPGARALEVELAASQMIPYTVHYDDETVITKDDGLLQVIRLEGLAFESLSDEQIRRYERRRDAVLRAIAASDRAVYVHLVRRRVQVCADGDGQTWFARQFSAAWRAHCEEQGCYANDIYVSIVCQRYRRGTPGWIDRLHGACSSAAMARQLEAALARQAQALREAADLVLQALGDYGARRLGILRPPRLDGPMLTREAARLALARCRRAWPDFVRWHGEHASYAAATVQEYLGEGDCEIARFLAYLVTLEDARVPLSDLPLDRTLACARLDFRMVGDTLGVHGVQASRAAAVLSMAEWPARTPSRLLDQFLRQPVEFVVTQSFFFADRIAAERALRQQRRRILVNDRDGAHAEDGDEIARGLEALTRGRAVNGLHHLSVLVHVPFTAGGPSADATAEARSTATAAGMARLAGSMAGASGDVAADGSVDGSSDTPAWRWDTLGRLDQAVGMLKTSFVHLGIKPVRESFALETFYWSQLPGQNPALIGRRGKIQSTNFAGFASLHNFAQGRLEGNLWGPAIMTLQTESGTPYHFNFHREIDGLVAGHTAIAADSGAGKTTLLAALIAMADKAQPRVVWFDNRQGATVFLRAMGGRHTVLCVQAQSGWNPFQLPDTAENRAYLVELQMLMRTCYGGAVTPDDMARFQRAVAENYSLPAADRRLRHLAWCYGTGELARTMALWHGGGAQPGANAGVFDNAHDTLDFTACRHHGFEMGQLIKDGVARPELAVLLSYPFHCIEQAMRGEPFIVVLEEGQHLVKHAYWREKIDSYLMQIRRKHGLLIFVTPDAKYLYCETDAIAKQTVTKLFLPNAGAARLDYVDALGLSHAEYEFIRDTPAQQRKFLIRRGGDSVRAVFDLTALAAFIPVLSSSDKAVALMEAVMDEVGSDAPELWVPRFMARAAAANTHNLARPLTGRGVEQGQA